VPTRMSIKLAAFAAATPLVFALSPVGSALAAGSTVLNLQLNEKAGAKVARDSSGLKHNGTIGSHVTMNGAYADWDRHSPAEGIDYGLKHLIIIPDAANGSLDPGSGNFSITLRFRTKDSFGNVLQKGQATTAGGQVKFQIPGGKLSCMFKTPTGTATATSGTHLLNDNQWHVVRCDRTPTSVTMYVDGVRTGRSNHNTGTLNNTKPWSIGGKAQCDAVKVSCDYFAGEIDYVTMNKAGFVTGTAGNDDLRGTPRSDTITALAGDDNVHARAGADKVSGGDGDDTVSAVLGNDRVFGGRGRDVLRGGSGADLLVDGPGHDRLLGGSGADALTVGGAADVASGGSGNDKIVVYRDGLPDRINCGRGAHDRAAYTGHREGHDTYVNCEKIVAYTP
jgi:Ca2+-binding RTX toxin-like protein